ncbi:S55 family peptidase [Oscillibacter valericigenes Sjm18-20]|nr:S55 family peptidase [Oscillibacter valericigenes Sjm18-20]
MAAPPHFSTAKIRSFANINFVGERNKKTKKAGFFSESSALSGLSERGDSMDETVERSEKPKSGRGGGAALRLAVLLLVSALTVPAAAADLSSAQALIPVGHTVGIKLFSRGVLVVKLAEGDTPAKACGLAAGDVIIQCAGNAVTSTEQFQSLLQNAGGEAAKLEIRRGSKTLDLSVTADDSDGDGKYAIGAWIRDSMAGIGTMTFYDPESNTFGALGHGITDVDTAALMPFSSGSILPSTVKTVKRGEMGAAGELKGNFDLTGDTGTLYANTSSGVFGTLSDQELIERFSENPLPVAENDQVHTGKATILANVDGDTVKEYDIEITKILNTDSAGRNLLITVTDPELLEKTGGIVQGMSGSPILQDGRLAGAVTHVLLGDPTRGYGLLIRNMLKNT